MSTAVRSGALPRGATDWHRLKHVLLSMLIGLRPMLMGYWAVMVVALFGGGLVIQLLTSGVTSSAWDYGTQSPKYFSMAVGITIFPAYFSLVISHGVTRKMFSVAAGIYLAGAAAATSLLWVVVYQVERGLYAAQGWPEKLTNPHLFTSPSQFGLVFAEFFLLILSHEASGWLLGISFVRHGFWRGILMLPFALLPAAAAEFLLVAQWLADVLDNLGYQRPPLALAVPSVLVVSALGVYAGYRLMQPMALKAPKG
ncbi:hypothetical protein [Kribbella shirazensis]|uniref:Putative membrane protein n=1 Tax=Kribbella shirazensis TaxID=1105143 RepID=A0A7X5VAE3_9ACTN|nr:hypothetical protein [Kribbella shirazensis]NIK56753.1 putative membrane protein [Kribbella shirazensis]